MKLYQIVHNRNISYIYILQNDLLAFIIKWVALFFTFTKNILPHWNTWDYFLQNILLAKLIIVINLIINMLTFGFFKFVHFFKLFGIKLSTIVLNYWLTRLHCRAIKLLKLNWQIRRKFWKIITCWLFTEMNNILPIQAIHCPLHLFLTIIKIRRIQASFATLYNRPNERNFFPCDVF